MRKITTFQLALIAANFVAKGHPNDVAIKLAHSLILDVEHYVKVNRRMKCKTRA